MQYEDKYISIEQALEMVKSGDVIVTGLGAAEAGLFMGQLHTIADRVRGVKVTNCLPCASDAQGTCKREYGVYPEPSSPGLYQATAVCEAEHLCGCGLYAG